MTDQHDTRPGRWVRCPQPGQFRGEGDWLPFEGTNKEWEQLQETRYLPTHEGVKPEGAAREEVL